MTNDQVAAAYYAGKTKGHNSTGSIFIEGETLYSYGSHFPMAVRLAPDVYAWNEDGYRMTTAKHRGQCYPYGKTIIPMDTETIRAWAYCFMYGWDKHEAGTIKRTLEHLAQRRKDCLTKEAHARTERMQSYWKDEAQKYDHAWHTINSMK